TQRKVQADERERLSHCLAPVLPRLMVKALSQVLSQLQELLLRHTGSEVLGAAARALGALCDPQLPLCARGDLARSRVVDELADKCHRHVTAVMRAFVALSDVLLVLGPAGTRGDTAALSPLRMVPDVALRSQLAAVLLDHVFSDSP
ncbi:hypothetical protein ASZ78_002569, partial [Callipepla squamata]